MIHSIARLCFTYITLSVITGIIREAVYSSQLRKELIIVRDPNSTMRC